MLLQANTPKRLYFGLKVIRQFSSVSPAPVLRCVQTAAVRDVLVPRPSVRLLSVSAVRWRPEELGSAPVEAPPPLSSAAEEKLFSPAAAADAPPPVSPAAEATPPPPEQVNITAVTEAVPSMSDPAPTFTAEVEAPPPAPAQEELIFEVPPPPEAEPPPSELEFTIPDKPSAPLDLGQVGEPTLESMGLASWWPSGRLQYFLESMHVNLGLEWFQAIAVATLCMRMLMIPAVVMAQRNVANMNNNTPQLAALQEKITDARRRGDMFEMAQLTQEMQKFMQKGGINPMKNMLPVALQMPVFMSFFFGLRGMANCPVDSMASGGALWFENLLITDPYYLLPAVTCISTYLQLRSGAEGAKLDTMGPKMKVAMTALPIVMFPFIMNFASGVTFYWACTNIISLGQARFFKIETIRALFKIPKMIQHKKAAPPPGKKKSFKESVKETIDNFRVQSQIVDRRAHDEAMFREAGKAAPIKTYKYDPTKISTGRKH